MPRYSVISDSVLSLKLVNASGDQSWLANVSEPSDMALKYKVRSSPGWSVTLNTGSRVLLSRCDSLIVSPAKLSARPGSCSSMRSSEE